REAAVGNLVNTGLLSDILNIDSAVSVREAAEKRLGYLSRPPIFLAADAAFLARDPQELATVLQDGADPNALDIEPPRLGLLHELARRDCFPWRPEDEILADKFAGLLLANGVNPNMGHGNDPGHTALHFAVYYGRVPLTRLLLEAGADPLIKNK